MGLFDRSIKEEKPNGNLNSGEGSAIKNAAGFSNLKEARNAAPSSTTGVQPTGEKPASTRGGKIPTRAEQEAAIKEAKRQEALQAAARRIMRKFAAGPYEVWAKVSDDDRFKLSEEETNELTEEYVGLANTVEIDFSKPIWLFVGVFSAHAMLISERLQYMSEKSEAEQKALDEQNDKDHPAQPGRKLN